MSAWFEASGDFFRSMEACLEHIERIRHENSALREAVCKTSGERLESAPTRPDFFGKSFMTRHLGVQISVQVLVDLVESRVGSIDHPEGQQFEYAQWVNAQIYDGPAPTGRLLASVSQISAPEEGHPHPWRDVAWRVCEEAIADLNRQYDFRRLAQAVARATREREVLMAVSAPAQRNESRGRL